MNAKSLNHDLHRMFMPFKMPACNASRKYLILQLTLQLSEQHSISCTLYHIKYVSCILLYLILEQNPTQINGHINRANLLEYKLARKAVKCSKLGEKNPKMQIYVNQIIFNICFHSKETSKYYFADIPRKEVFNRLKQAMSHML